MSDQDSAECNSSTMNAMPTTVFEENGIRKAICGYSWPGIEYGEPPCSAYTFFEYVDAIRFGDLSAFKRIEAATTEWFFPTLDRGAGALLHFAVDHGHLHMVKFLVEQRNVKINQRDNARGWTPLHRCARVAHYKHAPFMEIFEYLLSKGADPSLLTWKNPNDGSVIDLAVTKGYGWEEGQVRQALCELIAKYQGTTKEPEYVYSGPPHGPKAAEVIKAWESLPKLYPPEDWRQPPPAGYVGAQGMKTMTTTKA